MIQNSKRPQFFAGQLIDYKDLNRLVSYSEDTVFSITHLLFPGGGIISQALDEFSVQVESGWVVQVSAGVAILPGGQLCIAPLSFKVDLSHLKTLTREFTAIIGIRNFDQGEDYSVDPEEPSIVGFRSSKRLLETQISLDGSLSDSVEIFRIRLNSEVKELQVQPISQIWDDAQLGVINLHYRKKIATHGPFPEGTETAVSWRRGLYHLEKTLTQIRQRYLIDDPFQVSTFISLFHSEILHRPLQIAKVQYLLQELSTRLSLFLERMLREVPGKDANFDREGILRMIPKLEVLRKIEGDSNRFRIQEFMEVIQLLDDLSQFSLQGSDFVTRIRLAVEELKNTFFSHQKKLTFCGYTFELVDEVHPHETQRLVLRSDESQLRNVQVKYKSGDAPTFPGLFFKRGELDVPVQVKTLDRPLALLFRHYVRRPGTEIELIWNGKQVGILKFEDASQYHYWTNGELILPAGSLVMGENKLTLKIIRTENDFGFFGVSAYQPVLSGQGS